MKSSVSVIIISYESGETLDFCLSSLQYALQDLNHQIIVWDNASKTLSKDFFRSRYSDVEWHFHTDNIGFGKACNLASERAKYSNLVFLNPDTVSLENSIHPIVNELEANYTAGVVGGRVLNSDGTLQMACRRSFPTPINALYRLLGFSSLFPHSSKFAAYDLRYLDEHSRSEVDAVSGSFFGIRHSLFKDVGGFDERFFMYGEDLDLCRRVQLKDRDNIYIPSAPMIHLKGRSASARPWKSFYNFYEAMVVFSKIHYGQVMLAHLVLTIGVITSAFLAFNARILNRWRVIPIDAGMLCILALLFDYLFSVGFSPRPQEYVLLSSIAVFINLISGKYGSSQRWRSWQFLLYSTPGFFIVIRYLEANFSRPDSIAYVLLFPSFYLMRILLFWIYYKGFMFLRNRRKVVFVGSGTNLTTLKNANNAMDHIDCFGYITPPHCGEIISRENFLGRWGDLDRIYRSLGPFELWILSDKRAWWAESSSNLSRIMEKMPIFLVYETSQPTLFNVVSLHLDKLKR